MQQDRGLGAIVALFLITGALFFPEEIVAISNKIIAEIFSHPPVEDAHKPDE